MIMVRMSRHRALALADAIAAYEVPPLTLLGRAGRTDQEAETLHEEVRRKLLVLAAAIRGSGRGRPRKTSSVYLLPRDAVLQFKATVPTLFIPRSLHSVARRMSASAKPKRYGRRMLLGAALEERSRKQLDKRHLRRLAARLRKQREHERFSEVSRLWRLVSLRARRPTRWRRRRERALEAMMGMNKADGAAINVARLC